MSMRFDSMSNLEWEVTKLVVCLRPEMNCAMALRYVREEASNHVPPLVTENVEVDDVAFMVDAVVNTYDAHIGRDRTNG